MIRRVSLLYSAFFPPEEFWLSKTFHREDSMVSRKKKIHFIKIIFIYNTYHGKMNPDYFEMHAIPTLGRRIIMEAAQ